MLALVFFVCVWSPWRRMRASGLRWFRTKNGERQKKEINNKNCPK